ncbi:MAG: hypothetical protein CM15mP49_21760 [Actinomycetota bacterium]|nr:MAG: hypothetical protein CM15mP49_21760 [Actinomycetota bacterium]
MPFSSLVFHCQWCIDLDRTPESPDYCYFDLIFMRPRPSDRKVPDPPEVITLDIDESYSIVEGVGPLGKIYDQDTANLAAQTRRF